MINLDATKQLVNEQMLDVMEVTMCEHLHDLRPPEDLALFTYSCLLAPGQLQIVSVGDLLTYISQYIFNTWGIHIESTAMDLLEIPLHFAETRSSLVCFVNIVPTGLKRRK